MPINSTGFIKIPQDYAIKPVQKKDEESKQNLFVDKSLSQSAKYMIGATALAGVVALGIIGHRNNWWTNAKKVVQQESVKNSAEKEHFDNTMKFIQNSMKYATNTEAIM